MEHQNQPPEALAGGSDNNKESSSSRVGPSAAGPPSSVTSPSATTVSTAEAKTIRMAEDETAAAFEIWTTAARNLKRARDEAEKFHQQLDQQQQQPAALVRSEPRHGTTAAIVAYSPAPSAYPTTAPPPASVTLAPSSSSSSSSSLSNHNKNEKLPYPFYYYRDYSRDPDPDSLTLLTPPGRVPNFPAKMRSILNRLDLTEIVSWMPHGRAWRVLKPRDFEVQVIPVYFEHSKYSSFVRQANGWGFRRITQGKDRGCYCHPLFLRGLPHLTKRMKRPGVSEKTLIDPECEPDLYRISELYPVPEGPDPEGHDCSAQGGGSKARMPLLPPLPPQPMQPPAPSSGAAATTTAGHKRPWQLSSENHEPPSRHGTSVRESLAQYDLQQQRAMPRTHASLAAAGAAAPQYHLCHHRQHQSAEQSQDRRRRDDTCHRRHHHPAPLGALADPLPLEYLPLTHPPPPQDHQDLHNSEHSHHDNPSRNSYESGSNKSTPPLAPSPTEVMGDFAAALSGVTGDSSDDAAAGGNQFAVGFAAAMAMAQQQMQAFMMKAITQHQQQQQERQGARSSTSSPVPLQSHQHHQHSHHRYHGDL